MDRTLGKFLIKIYCDLKDFRNLDSVNSNRKSLLKRLSRSISLIISSLTFVVALFALTILTATGSLNLEFLDFGFEAINTMFVFAVSFIFAAGIKAILQPIIKRILGHILNRRFAKSL